MKSLETTNHLFFETMHHYEFLQSSMEKEIHTNQEHIKKYYANTIQFSVATKQNIHVADVGNTQMSETWIEVILSLILMEVKILQIWPQLEYYVKIILPQQAFIYTMFAICGRNITLILGNINHTLMFGSAKKYI